SVGVLYSDADSVDAEGTKLPETFLEHYLPTGARPEGDVFDALIVRCFIPSLTTLVRRPCFDAVGGYDPAIPIEDWDLWPRMARLFRFAFLPVTTARYRVLSTSRL